MLGGQVLKTTPPNDLGSDFVVGDLHGCYPALEKALAQQKFNPEIDRLFSVGDLIDRGPDSLGCLRLLQEPWFCCVMGNHEQLMLDYLDNPTMDAEERWRSNGGNWFFNLDDLELAEVKSLAEVVADLPVAVIVEKADGTRIGISHAQPPSEWTEQIIISEAPELLWGRNKIFSDEYERAGGVDLSYHGHTITKEVHFNEMLQAKWIDLGCFSKRQLSIEKMHG